MAMGSSWYLWVQWQGPRAGGIDAGVDGVHMFGFSCLHGAGVGAGPRRQHWLGLMYVHEQSRCQACTCVAAGTECRFKYSSAGWWHESRSAAYRYTAPEDPFLQLSPSRIMQLWCHGPQLLELRRHHTPPKMESCHAPLHLVPPSIRCRSKQTLGCSHPQWSIFLPVQKVWKQWVLLQMHRHWHSAAELMKSGKHDTTKGTQWRPRNWHWR